MTDRQTDGPTEAIAVSPNAFLKKRGDNEYLTINIKVSEESP